MQNNISHTKQHITYKTPQHKTLCTSLRYRLIITPHKNYHMEFHPKNIPVLKTYDLKDEDGATKAAEDMVRLGFKDKKGGYRILMPKGEQKIAKRIGYVVTTGVTHGLRKINEHRDVKYWTYHHDNDHYAIVLISNKSLNELGFDD